MITNIKYYRNNNNDYINALPIMNAILRHKYALLGSLLAFGNLYLSYLFRFDLVPLKLPYDLIENIIYLDNPVYRGENIKYCRFLLRIFDGERLRFRGLGLVRRCLMKKE